MDPTLKVVNLCSNQILGYGLKGLFTGCEDIAYYHFPPGQEALLSNVSDPDVIILEDNSLKNSQVQEFTQKNASISIFLNLQLNEIVIVQQKQMGLEQAGDLLEIIRSFRKL